MASDWLGRFRRERRVLARVRRAAWRLEQAERERDWDWALASARADGLSVRKTAEAAGLSPTRVHQLTKDASVDVLEAVLSELRAAGWLAPEDPDGSEDEELPGHADVAARLVDEVGWIRRCAEWIDHLKRENFPPVVNLRPEADSPERPQVVVDLPRVAAVLRRIAYDVDELARARSLEDLDQARIRDEPRAERRRRLAEPDLTFTAFCARTGIPAQSIRQGESAWTAYQDERHRRGETNDNPYTAYNPFRGGRS
ncbi:hypothetical protein [Streptomyces sp. A1547]|uniref:hypothetical protein n=1 Tax=Streptomyces sp. A1547 TaxID=2563105 RepID=UPI00109E9E3F|nr:hypothetical protein [Streptomyces sp. A1547]THA33725.1 hypothetical protein E6W17_30990 [Streptomyces sp. A1547]